MANENKPDLAFSIDDEGFIQTNDQHIHINDIIAVCRDDLKIVLHIKSGGLTWNYSSQENVDHVYKELIKLRYNYHKSVTDKVEIRDNLQRASIALYSKMVERFAL